MPETVAGYHLFQLPCARESGETVSYAEYLSPNGPDGHYSQVLYGADTGLRRFSIPYDNLSGAASSATITAGGVSMNRGTYIRDLFHQQKVDGLPFVVQSGETNNYYLARFAESEQTLTKKLSASYATTVDLVQVRIPGVSVFDVSEMSGILSWLDANQIAGATDGNQLPAGSWPDMSGNGADFSTGPTTLWFDDTQNELPVVRLDGAASVLTSDDASPTVSEIFMVMKMRETTFSNIAGLFTAQTTLALLVGENAATTFFDFSATYDYLTYRKNGIEYDQDNQQAPMDQFGLVHLRATTPIAFASSVQIGKDRDFVGRFADADIAEVVIFEDLQPLSYSRELSEHLQAKWGI
jgi:hypothetical protein